VNSTLDKIDHRYYLNGNLIPSVTQIIKLLTEDKFKYVDKKLLQDKADFGTEVHKEIENYDTGNYNWILTRTDVDILVQKYVEFCSDYNCKPKYNELSLYHSKLIYAGTIDKICTIDGKEVILDIKTGRYYKEHYIQLAAYSQLVNNNKLGRNLDGGLLYLSSEGYKFKMLSYKDMKEYFEVFKALLTIYNYINVGGKNGKEK